jgi:peroxiredoxin Q/BCP
VGISGDLPTTHQLFKELHELEFALLSDPRGELASRFGVAVGKGCKVRVRDVAGQPKWDADRKSIILHRPVTLSRATFVVDRDGRIIYKNTTVNPALAGEEISRFLDERARQ